MSPLTQGLNYRSACDSMLWCSIIGYGIALKLRKSKYKIRYTFMGSSFIFQFLDINILNYYYFHTDSSVFS